jgi:hypothetical protein
MVCLLRLPPSASGEPRATRATSANALAIAHDRTVRARAHPSRARAAASTVDLRSRTWMSRDAFRFATAVRARAQRAATRDAAIECAALNERNGAARNDARCSPLGGLRRARSLLPGWLAPRASIVTRQELLGFLRDERPSRRRDHNMERPPWWTCHGERGGECLVGGSGSASRRDWGGWRERIPHLEDLNVEAKRTEQSGR